MSATRNNDSKGTEQQQPRQVQDSRLATVDYYIRHEREETIDDLAKHIEGRLIARAATFLLINAGALIVSIGTGIAAYYALDKRQGIIEQRQISFEEIIVNRIDINSARIERLIDEDRQIRLEIRENQTALINQGNGLAAYLREHEKNLVSNLREHDRNQTRESAIRSVRDR